MILRIQFYKNRSPKYKRLLRFFHDHDKLKTVIEDDIPCHSMEFNIYTELREFELAYVVIKDWKYHSVYLLSDGEQPDLATKQLDEQDVAHISGVLKCYSEYCSEGCRKDFCFGVDSEWKTPNLLGCIWIRVAHSRMYGLPWYHFGKLDKNNVWHLNRNWLESKIKAFAGETFAELCPVFDYQAAVTKPLASLPDTIDPETDSRFAYAKDYDPLKGDLVITGIEYDADNVGDPEFEEENDIFLKGESSQMNLGAKLDELTELKEEEDFIDLKNNIRKARPKDFS